MLRPHIPNIVVILLLVFFGGEVVNSLLTPESDANFWFGVVMGSLTGIMFPVVKIVDGIEDREEQDEEQ